jgi:hypothetical protein
VVLPTLALQFKILGLVVTYVLLPIVNVLEWIVKWIEKAITGLTRLVGLGGDSKKKFSQLTPRGGGGTEAIQATYNRIQAAAIKSSQGRDPQQDTADNTRRMADKMDGVKDSVDGVKGAVQSKPSVIGR